jgi:hypothetical protein
MAPYKMITLRLAMDKGGVGKHVCEPLTSTSFITHRVRKISLINYLINHQNLTRVVTTPHFTGETLEAQRVEATLPKKSNIPPKV